MTGIAFVGAGFVADYYMTTLPNHPSLTLKGAFDCDPDRLAAFCAFHGVASYPDFASALGDPSVDILVNLTNPESHYEINRAALEAGKHVYCEKPLAMALEEAEELRDLAAERKLLLCSAPANGLSEAFERFSTELETGAIGRPRLVYAQMEDGPVFRDNWSEWSSRSGAPWPGPHEFEIGCTLEHAGYGLSWLLRLFGPVEELTAFSALTFPDKGKGTDHLSMAADFSVGCLQFENGVVGKLTCGLAAPRDRSLTVVGDEGMLVLRDLWDNDSAIQLSRDGREKTLAQKIGGRIERKLGRTLPVRWADGHTLPQSRSGLTLPDYPSKIDFARGVAHQAAAVGGGPTPFYSCDVAVHLTELALALQNGVGVYKPRNRFDMPGVSGSSSTAPVQAAVPVPAR